MKNLLKLGVVALFALPLGYANAAQARPAPQEWGEVLGNGVAEVRELCARLPRRMHERISIGVMPMLYRDLSVGRSRGPDEDRPFWVPEGGVEMGKTIADRMSESMPEADVFWPGDIALRLADFNKKATAIRDVSGVRASGHMLGFDAILCGRITKVRVGAAAKYNLECEVTAVDVLNNRIAGSARWTIDGSDSRNRPLYEALGRSSDWAVEDSLDLDFNQGLEEALDYAEKAMASRVKGVIGREGGGGKSGDGEAGGTGSSGGKPPSGEAGGTGSAGGKPPSGEAGGTGSSGGKPPSGEAGGTGSAGGKPPSGETGTGSPPASKPVVGGETGGKSGTEGGKDPQPPAGGPPQKAKPQERVEGYRPALPKLGNSMVFIAPAHSPGIEGRMDEIAAHMKTLKKTENEIIRVANEQDRAPNYNVPVTLGGQTFDSFEKARTHVDGLKKAVADTGAGRLCNGVTLGIMKSIQPLESHAVMPINSLPGPFVDELASALRSGTLANQPAMVKELRDAKIDVLVMPYFVDCGSYYAIRGRVVDLSEPSRVHTTYVALHKDHHGELAKQLGN